MEIFSGLSRGSFLVCIGWTTLIVTNDVGRVGQAFIVSMLTMFLLGPFIGTIVDRHSHKWLVILAHLSIAMMLGWLGFAWVATAMPAIWPLFLIIAATSALRLMHNSAHDGLIQAATSPSRVMTTVARFRAVHLIATAIGTVLSGLVIEHISPASGFLFSAACSLVLCLPMLFIHAPKTAPATKTKPTFFADMRASFAIFTENRALRLLALLAAVSLPVGQLSNAALSSLVRNDLGKGSDAFGFVEGAWPVGGMLAAALLSLGLAGMTKRNMEYIFATLAGLATLGLSLAPSIPTLALLHAAMGMFVWLCRIVIDGRILQLTTSENVGRTKVGVEMAFSLAALIMCLSPTLAPLPSAAPYFMFWGGLVTLVALLIWAFDRKNP
nr:MFS transporter [Shimia abyssi]